MVGVGTLYGGVKPPRGTLVNPVHPLARGLVGVWLFNENGGRPVEIASRLGVGTAGGTAAMTWGANRGVFSALTVLSYGAKDVIPNGSTGATWVMSIRPANFTQVASILNKRSAFNVQNSWTMGFSLVTASDWNVALGNGGTSQTLVYRWPTTGWSTTALQQIAVVADSTLGALARVKTYRNGALVPLTAATTDASQPIAASTATLDIGRVNNGTVYYGGDIEYAFIYNRALTALEITQLAANPYQMFGTPLALALVTPGVVVPPFTWQQLTQTEVPAEFGMRTAVIGY